MGRLRDATEELAAGPHTCATVRRLHRRDWLSMGLICLASAAIGWPSLHDPLYSDAAGWFVGSVQDILRGHGNPIVQPRNDVGHPPLVASLTALAWAVAPSDRLLASHIVAIVLGMTAPIFLFLTVRHLTGSRIDAGLCALLLLTSPYYAGQICITYNDLPSAGFGTAAIYYAVVGSPWGLAIAAALGSLTKPTTIAPIACAQIWLVRSVWQRHGLAGIRSLCTPGAASAVPFLAWFGVHYAINGYPFNPPGLTGRGGYESAYAAAKQWAAVNLVLLVEDWRFLLSAGAVLAVAMLLLTGRPASSRQTGSTMWLMASTIPACTTAICMGVTVLMRRYLLPALPAYYAVTYLPIRHCRRSAAYVIGSAVIGLQVWSWFTPTAPSLPVDIGEASPMQSPTDWRYRDILYCHRNAAAFLSDNWHHASILTHEPFIRELTISDIGYVREPLRAVRYSQDQRLLSQRFDVICVETDSPWPSGKPLLEAVTEALNKGTLIQVTAFERRWCRVVVLRRSGVATR